MRSRRAAPSRPPRSPAALPVFLLALLPSTLMAATGDLDIASITPPASDLLRFLDGGVLHGELQSMDTDRGVRWRHPAAKNVIQFSPANLSLIRFEKVKSIQADAPATCRFEFTNGDEVYGSLNSLSTDKLELDAPFGGSLEAARASVQTLTFYHNGFNVLYEGPNGPEGWRLDKSPRGWQYRDGAFVTSTVGILGRDLKLKGPCNFEFDLAWTGAFSLSFMLYAESIDRFDYSQNSYMFHLAPAYLNVQRVQAGVGVTSLGQAHLPDLFREKKVRMQIRTNKDDSSIGIWANGTLIQKWKDHSGLVTRGSGVVFSCQMDGAELRLSNIRVTEWDSALEPASFDRLQSNSVPAAVTAPLRDDIIYLGNRDKVLGKVHEIRDGKLVITIEQTTLEVPITRVTQINFAPSDIQMIARHPWEIRVDVAGGGRVSFELDKWTDQRISGRSSNFGLVAFNPESIRQIQFNPERPSFNSPDAKVDQWDIDE